MKFKAQITYVEHCHPVLHMHVKHWGVEGHIIPSSADSPSMKSHLTLIESVPQRYLSLGNMRKEEHIFLGEPGLFDDALFFVFAIFSSFPPQEISRISVTLLARF